MAAAESPGPAAAAPGGPEPDGMGLTDLPGELLELILCCDVLGAADIGRVSCTCRRLREACQPRGKVWRERFRLRWAARPGPPGAALAVRASGKAGEGCPGSAQRPAGPVSAGGACPGGSGAPGTVSCVQRPGRAWGAEVPPTHPMFVSSASQVAC